MDTMEESGASLRWAQNPMHGGVREDFVERSNLKSGIRGEGSCVEDFLEMVS